MLILLYIFWFIWELKYILFWIYLWQLKEYHAGRFIDHFRTSKGKKLAFNLVQITKLILLLAIVFNNNLFAQVFSILSIIYFIEIVLFARNIINNNVKRPKATIKTGILIFSSLFIAFVFIYYLSNFEDITQLKSILIFDILTPLIASLVVIVIQPFFVLLINITLKRAEEKIEKVKELNNLKVVAITGSYGKTSTKEFLTTILSEKFKVLSTKDNQNAEIGIAKCILNNLKPSHQIFIAEVAAYDKGKVKQVCSVIKPKIGIVTGVNEQHLSVFGSLKNLLLGEGGGELAQFLEKEGTLIVNGDNKHCLDLYKRFDGYKKIYSEDNKKIDSDIWADHLEINRDHILFVALDKERNMANFNAEVLGRHNIQNLLGAILVAKELGMSFEEISNACEKISQKQGGMVLKKGKHGINIIDSSYSANPDGVLADIEYLSIYQNKKVIVMPCLIELGKDSGNIHRKIGKKIGKVCDLAIITSKDKFKDIVDGARESGMKPKDILLCDDSQDIYSAITLFCKSGDVVLLEGRVPKLLIDLMAE